MQSFKDGTRRNDISEQMRSVARQLTSEEIAMLAAHYSSISDPRWTLEQSPYDENNIRFNCRRIASTFDLRGFDTLAKSCRAFRICIVTQIVLRLSLLRQRDANGGLHTAKRSLCHQGGNAMEALLGFSLDFWDYATFLSLFFLVAVGSRIHCVYAWSSRKNRHRPQPSRSRGGLSDGLGWLPGGRAVGSGAGLGL